MAATESKIQQIIKPKQPLRLFNWYGYSRMPAAEPEIQQITPHGQEIPSLYSLALQRIGSAPLKNPGFFNSKEAMYSHLIKDHIFADLLYYAGFGKRTKAKDIIMAYPEFLLRRGNLIDISRTTYEDITVFAYAVKVKDSHLVKKIVDFLETYQGHDKNKIVTDLLKQFDCSFNPELLSSVSEFIEACNTLDANAPNLTYDEMYLFFIQSIGKAQTHFTAHVLQEYCHPFRSFKPEPKFNETNLPENLSFYNWNGPKSDDSLLTTSPGIAGNFVLLRGKLPHYAAGRDMVFTADMDNLKDDCVALYALDRARTTDLLLLRNRLMLIHRLVLNVTLTPPVMEASSLYAP